MGSLCCFAKSENRDLMMSASRHRYLDIKRALGVLTGKDIWQEVQVKCGVLRLGNDGACWSIHPKGLSKDSVIYSCGVGEDVSFDQELIRRFGATVHAFDPTPRTVQWLRTQSISERFIFHQYGIADYDGCARFFPPDDPSHVSHSMVRRKKVAEGIEVLVYRLTTIMNMLGHGSIDLLKMDVEGAEYAVLRDVLTSGICVRQLLVEFHHRWPEIGLNRTREAIRDLNRAGYRIFDISPKGEEYSFVLASAGDAARSSEI
jgi:FkbM family methyltransferase